MKWMPLSEIRVGSGYLRMGTDIESLKRSIETVGLINPLTVNEQNELLAGGRRYSALKALGWDEVPVNVIDRSELEQELIAIDENLVRRPLDKLELEHCLNRGRQIYELLHPEATKVELTPPQTPGARKAELADEKTDEDSFVAITADKTGLSKRMIKGAIRRDALSSERVKEARNLIGASRTNELIKLDKEDQDKILPHLAELPLRAVKDLIDTAQEHGVEEALAATATHRPPPREFVELAQQSKRLRKVVSKILDETIHYEGNQRAMILEDVRELIASLQRLVEGDEKSAAEAEVGAGTDADADRDTNAVAGMQGQLLEG